MSRIIFTFCLACCITLTACSSSQQSGPETSTASPDLSSSLTSSRVGRMEYQQCGEADTTLLFVHGWCIDQSYWAEQVAAFCPRYQVITVNLPGFHGDTVEREAVSIAAYSQDIQALIDQLKLDQVVLIGHSMGGDIILETALNRTEQVIALVGVDNFKDAGFPLDEETQAAIAGFMEALQADYVNVVSAYADQYLFHPSTDSTIRDRVLTDYLSVNEEVAIHSLKSLFEYSSREIPHLKQLQKPVFLINSDATPTDLTYWEAEGLSATVLSVGETGHFPMVEAPEVVNKRLQEILDQVGSQ